jgi:hypothetical protein
MHFLVVFKKILPLKRYKIALTTFWRKKNLMNNTGIFYLIWLKFWFKKIWETNFLRKYCFSLDPDPDWAKMLDPDPYWINPDPQPCFPLPFSLINILWFFYSCTHIRNAQDTFCHILLPTWYRFSIPDTHPTGY